MMGAWSVMVSVLDRVGPSWCSSSACPGGGWSVAVVVRRGEAAAGEGGRETAVRSHCVQRTQVPSQRLERQGVREQDGEDEGDAPGG